MLTDLLLRDFGVEPFSWGVARLELEGSGRDQYIAALKAADTGEYRALLTFVRT